jgi:hypothetical protein
MQACNGIYDAAVVWYQAAEGTCTAGAQLLLPLLLLLLVVVLPLLLSSREQSLLPAAEPGAWTAAAAPLFQSAAQVQPQTVLLSLLHGTASDASTSNPAAC